MTWMIISVSCPPRGRPLLGGALETLRPPARSGSGWCRPVRYAGENLSGTPDLAPGSGVLRVLVGPESTRGRVRLAAAQIGDLDAVTRAVPADRRDQRLRAVDDLVVDLGDHVPHLQAGLVGGTALLDRAQLRALGQRVAADIGDRDTEPGVGRGLLVGDLVDDRQHLVDRDREAQPDRTALV